mmetsp:Transcript_13529/g.41855  ORF Transcript_13529/g.41855 Transcript_13529/m.41855 type:complete len:374 (-) Transcript_13529:21-1142(-)
MVRAQLHENKGKAGRGPGPGRRDPVDARERRHGLAAGRVAGGRLPERADLALRHARAGAHGSAAGRPGRGGRRVSAECREGLPECRPAAQGPTSRVRPGARHEFEREEAAHELLVPPLRRLPFEGGLRRVRVAARRGLLQVRGRLGLLVPRAAGALRRAGLRDRLPEHEKAHHVPRVQLPIGAHGAGGFRRRTRRASRFSSARVEGFLHFVRGAAARSIAGSLGPPRCSARTRNGGPCTGATTIRRVGTPAACCGTASTARRAPRTSGRAGAWPACSTRTCSASRRRTRSRSKNWGSDLFGTNSSATTSPRRSPRRRRGGGATPRSRCGATTSASSRGGGGKRVGARLRGSPSGWTPGLRSTSLRRVRLILNE